MKSVEKPQPERKKVNGKSVRIDKYTLNLNNYDIMKVAMEKGKTMLALPSASKEAGRLAANINRVTPMWVGSLNVVDLLNHINVVTTVDGIKEIEKMYKSAK